MMPRTITLRLSDTAYEAVKRYADADQTMSVGVMKVEQALRRQRVRDLRTVAVIVIDVVA
jgi:hypothetical protein